MAARHLHSVQGNAMQCRPMQCNAMQAAPAEQAASLQSCCLAMQARAADLLAGRLALNLAAVPLRQGPPHRRWVLLIHLRQQQHMASGSVSIMPLGSSAACPRTKQCQGYHAPASLSANTLHHMTACYANPRLVGATLLSSSGCARPR